LCEGLFTHFIEFYRFADLSFSEFVAFSTHITPLYSFQIRIRFSFLLLKFT
jgi:hypothetical protein